MGILSEEKLIISEVPSNKSWLEGKKQKIKAVKRGIIPCSR